MGTATMQSQDGDRTSEGPRDSGITLLEERSEHILRITADCIAEQGYDGVRLRDVSKRAGVSVGLIQHYFDTRETLLSQAIKYLSEQLTSQFSLLSGPQESAWQQIEALIDELCSVPDLKAHSTMWIAFASAVSKHPELRPDLTSVYRSWERYVRNAVDRGERTGEFNLVGERDDVIAVFLAFFDGYEYDMGTGLLPADTVELRRRALLTARALFRP